VLVRVDVKEENASAALLNISFVSAEDDEEEDDDDDSASPLRRLTVSRSESFFLSFFSSVEKEACWILVTLPLPLLLCCVRILFRDDCDCDDRADEDFARRAIVVRERRFIIVH